MASVWRRCPKVITTRPGFAGKSGLASTGLIRCDFCDLGVMMAHRRIGQDRLGLSAARSRGSSLDDLAGRNMRLNALAKAE